MDLIDIVIVSGRRPELLKRTVESFKSKIIDNFSVNRVFVNIDPFCGTAVDAKIITSFLKENFVDIEIFEPEMAGFGAAVKRLWSHTVADYVLHMEDDWEAISEIKPSDVFPYFDDKTKVLSIMAETKNWNGKQVFHYHRKRSWRNPLKLEDKSRPIFTTSPSFWNGVFMRGCAELMDDKFDPEKQFYSGVNKSLESHVSTYRNRFLVGQNDINLIRDIGREWREKKQIEKKIIDSVSIWRKV